MRFLFSAHFYSLFLILAISSLLSSCRGSVAPDGEKLASVSYGKNERDNNQSGTVTFSENVAHESAVSTGCLSAWRKAVAGDEAGAMEMLEKLDAKFPGISTVQFMMGQVKDRAGKHEEAVSHYKKAVAVNEYSSIQTYRLAQSMRKSGDSRGAIVYFEKLEKNLTEATDEHGRGHLVDLLSSVRIGKARAMLECGYAKTDVLALLREILQRDPNNKEAKSLLKELETSPKS